MPIAKLNRDALRNLADSRLEEARVLLENKLWTGAYYLAGLAVECALKACMARAVREYDFPDKKFVNDMYQHDLKNLVGLDAALREALHVGMKADPKLEVNWNTVKDWKDEKRYDIVEELEAKGLYGATAEPGSGVMQWIRGRW